MRVLHISADYADPLQPAKTHAVNNLLTAVPDIEHRVYSLNRVGWRAGVHALSFEDAAGVDHRAVAYGAPPKGLFLARFLDRLADWLADDLDRSGFRPDVIHAHKVSVEGLVADSLAKRTGLPVALSVQGDSDLKIIGAKRDLRSRYAAIWTGAAATFPFAPWAASALDALLGRREGPVRLLPCPASEDAPFLPPKTVGPQFRTAFHLASAKRKNAAALIRAIGRAASQVPDIRLEILGGGDPAAFARLTRVAERAAPGRVRFRGATPHRTVRALFNASCGFALVSKRESFGMVFSEALIAGAPCLTPRGRGIDGFFEEGGVLLAAAPEDEQEIAERLVQLAREERAFKARLAALADAGGLDFLRRSAIAATYRSGLAAACATGGRDGVGERSGAS